MKRIFKILILTLCVTLFSVAFTGCVSSGEIKDYVDKVFCMHEYGAEVQVQRSTCVEHGKAEKTCTLCGKVETVELAFTPHAYVETVKVEPTCVEHGIIEKTCSECGEFEVCTTTLGPHDVVTYDYVEQTCDKPGYYGLKKCIHCDEIFAFDREILPNEHDYVYYEYVAPTCTTYGNLSHHKCATCGYSPVDYILPPTAHAYYTVPAKIPTSCAESGYSEHRVCRVCGWKAEYIEYSSGHVARADGICSVCNDFADEAAMFEFYSCSDNYTATTLDVNTSVDFVGSLILIEDINIFDVSGLLFSIESKGTKFEYRINYAEATLSVTCNDVTYETLEHEMSDGYFPKISYYKLIEPGVLETDKLYIYINPGEQMYGAHVDSSERVTFTFEDENYTLLDTDFTLKVLTPNI